jgi:hypothetical protein
MNNSNKNFVIKFPLISDFLTLRAKKEFFVKKACIVKNEPNCGIPKPSMFTLIANSS